MEIDEDEEAYRSMQREGLISARDERPAAGGASGSAAGVYVLSCVCPCLTCLTSCRSVFLLFVCSHVLSGLVQIAGV